VNVSNSLIDTWLLVYTIHDARVIVKA